MPITVTMPALSPTMTEGTIAKWLKKEGDRIEVGDPLCEITTDKSTVEFQSIEEGFLAKIVIHEGGHALVNQGIAVITEKANEDVSKYILEEPNLVKVAPPETEEEVKKEQFKEAPVREKMTAMTTITFQPVPPRKEYLSQRRSSGVKASPLAKKIAEEKKLDLASVKGSGPDGRVLAKDLELAQSLSPFLVSPEEEPTLPPGTYEEESLSPIRKVIGERLQASKMQIPHYYVRNSVCMDRAIDLRNQLKEMQLKVTFNDFVMKAVALALRSHPEVNSGFNSLNQTIIRFKTIDISVAVSIPSGLITPIVCHADFKSVFEISEETRLLAKKAKEGTLQPEEYQGGSFTVSNLGMYGVTSFDPVINPPQAAILGVGGIHEKVTFKNNQISIANMMELTLSLDHRVVDGAQGASFLLTLKKLLENPVILVT